MNYQWIIDQIPDYEVFMTVDELDASSRQLVNEYPDIVELREIGKSRNGHPILCLVIGRGSQNALLFASPHPNEPMGCMMIEYFSRLLAENDELREELDYTWYFIKCIDCDGTRLNEGWFKGPFTLTHFWRDYYRPADYEQVEWTFPLNYKNYSFNDPLPETQALMKMIDETKPLFMYSLHNTTFGGTYWYLSRELEAVWDRLYNANQRQGLPLHLGEPEENQLTPYAPAIFPMIDQGEIYEFYETYSDVPPESLMLGGDSSFSYAAKYGTTLLVTELPNFYDPRIADLSELPFSRREAMRRNQELYWKILEQADELYRVIEPYLSGDNPFANTVEINVRNYRKQYELELRHIDENPIYDEPCTVAEGFDSLEIRNLDRLFYLTLLRRSCEHELQKADHPGYELLLRVHAEVANAFEAAAAVIESEFNYTVIPIRKLVSVQLESGLVLADYLMREKRDHARKKADLKVRGAVRKA